MNIRQHGKKLLFIITGFLILFYLPVNNPRFQNAVLEALHLTRWYAREHVLLCLIPAFFIAGAIGVFVSQASVMKYLGAQAHKVIAYSVAAVSGSILAVCSCTILPLFAGIYKMGAGLGPATAFLYSGPAINVLAIILTARILGLELGIARAVGAVLFSIVIGLLMHIIYRKEEREKAANANKTAMPDDEDSRPLWKSSVYFAVLVAILVFANWGAPSAYSFTLNNGKTINASIIHAPENTSATNAFYRIKYIAAKQNSTEDTLPCSAVVSKKPLPGVWTTVWQLKWWITATFSLILGIILIFWFSVKWWKICLAALPPTLCAIFLPTHDMWILLPFGTAVIGLSIVLNTSRGEIQEWFDSSFAFAMQILPLLLGGVLIAGLLLGRVGHEGLIPSKWIALLVGGNSIWANFFAAIVGAFMYFATLTEVPILQGLIGNGMGKGPALALLLAGPALSLPNMIVIRSVLGTKKTITFVVLVVIMATISGMLFGTLF